MVYPIENEETKLAWEILRDCGISEETLQCITDINGFNLKTLNDVCYWRFGLRDYKELSA